jgi:hypothetical protein
MGMRNQKLLQQFILPKTLLVIVASMIVAARIRLNKFIPHMSFVIYHDLFYHEFDLKK